MKLQFVRETDKDVRYLSLQTTLHVRIEMEIKWLY